MAAIGPRLSEVAKQFRGFEEERGVTVAADSRTQADSAVKERTSWRSSPRGAR